MSSNQYLEQLEETLEDLKKLVSQRTSPNCEVFCLWDNR